MNPSPVVVLAVCHKDIAQACAWLRWVMFLASDRKVDVAGEDLLVFLTQRVAHNEKAVQDLIEATNYDFRFRTVFDTCRDECEDGYPRSASHHFLRALECCEENFPGRPILFCEPDTTPMRPKWFNELAAEYASCGKPFNGARVNHNALEGSHCSGNACYAPNWRELLPSLQTVLAAPDHPLWPAGKGQPFDTWIRADIMPHFHESVLTQQIFHCPAFTKDNLHLVKPETAIFHRNKDASLIAALARTRYPKFAETLPAPTRHFCTTRHPSQLATHGYSFTGWRTIKRPTSMLSIITPTDPLDELVLGCLVGSKGVNELTAAERQRLIG